MLTNRQRQRKPLNEDESGHAPGSPAGGRRRGAGRAYKEGGSLDNWLAIANLFVTIFVGIVIAVFLNLRQEHLQKQLIEIESRTNIDYSLAELSLSQCDRDVCSDQVTLVNHGPAIARNVRITLELVGVPANWANTISSINDFEIYEDPPTLAKMVTSTQTLSGSDLANSRRNLVVLAIDALAPEETLVVGVDLQGHIPRQSVETTGTLTFSPAGSSPIPNVIVAGHIQREIDRFLAEEYMLAQFDINTFCENCRQAQALSHFTLPVADLQGPSITLHVGGEPNINVTVAVRYNLPEDSVIPSNSELLDANAYYVHDQDREVHYHIYDRVP